MPPRACPQVYNKAGQHWHTDGTGITIFTAPHVHEEPERVTRFLCGYRAFDLLSPDQQHIARNALVRMGAEHLTGSSQAHDTERGARMSANGCRQERGVDEALMTEEDWISRKAQTSWLERFARQHEETGRWAIHTIVSSHPVLLVNLVLSNLAPSCLTLARRACARSRMRARDVQ